MKTFAIKTFGCQMNISDSERVAAVCKAMGYQESTDDTMAQLYVINTCSVRQKAEDRVLGMGRQFFQFKEKNTDVKVILTGCMAKRDIRQGFEKSTNHQEKYSGSLIKKMPWVDHVLEINDMHTLPEILGEKVENTVNDYFAVTPQYNSKLQAFVPISTGCNKFCTFCIVPFTRGKEVYRPFEEIYNEVKSLIDNGYKEITLLGQNVNSWKSTTSIEAQIPIPGLRKNTVDGMDFADLMEALAQIPGDFWLRFTSSHPYDINPRLIEVVAKYETIAKQFHFALQSGSNTMLKRMNRHYTREEFRDKVLAIKNTIPNVGLTTDVIVGFSGETEQEFNDTVSLCEELNFDQIFISEYSRREGTIAAKFYKDDISNEVKTQRKEILDKVLKDGVIKSNATFIGTIQKVLVYKSKIKNRNGVFARTTQCKDVLITSEKNLPNIGSWATVKITGFKGFCLEGEVVE